MAKDEISEHQRRVVGPEHPAAAANGSTEPGRRGRHDIVEDEDSGFFWPEVDGMLTGDFSSELANLPVAGQYRLGVVADDELDPVRGPNTLSAETISATPADSKSPPPAPRVGIGSVLPDPPEPEYDDSGLARLFDDPVPTGADMPAGSVGLFDSLDEKPAAGSSRGLDWTDALPKVETGGGPKATRPPPTAETPRFDAPLIEFPQEPKLSTPAAAPPISLEHSTVVDPQQGSPPGSSFLDGGIVLGDERAGTGDDPFVAGGFDRGPQSDDPYRSLNLTRSFGGMDRFGVLRDILDRRWFTTALAGAVAVVLGVVGWVTFAADRVQGSDVVSDGTTVAGPTAGQVSTTATVEATLTTLPATTERLTTSTISTTTTRRRATTAAPTTAAPTTTTTAAPTTTTAAPTTTTTEPATTTTTAPTTTTTEPATTTTTEPATTTTEPATTTTTTAPTTTTTTTTPADPP